MSNAEARSELARRIRAARAVSVTNDPGRSYRRAALRCLKTGAGYNQQFGIGKAPKS